MFVREYIYTFIQGQPAFTEVTLIVNGRLSSLPTHRRGTRRDAQIKGPTTLGYAARRQRVGSGFLLNKQRHTQRTHVSFFFFSLNLTTTQQQPKRRPCGARFHAAAMSWKASHDFAESSSFSVVLSINVPFHLDGQCDTALEDFFTQRWYRSVSSLSPRAIPPTVQIEGQNRWYLWNRYCISTIVGRSISHKFDIHSLEDRPTTETEMCTASQSVLSFQLVIFRGQPTFESTYTCVDTVSFAEKPQTRYKSDWYWPLTAFSVWKLGTHVG